MSGSVASRRVTAQEQSPGYVHAPLEAGTPEAFEVIGHLVARCT